MSTWTITRVDTAASSATGRSSAHQKAFYKTTFNAAAAVVFRRNHISTATARGMQQILRDINERLDVTHVSVCLSVCEVTSSNTHRSRDC